MVLHQALIILMDKSYLIDITGMNGYICEPKIEDRKVKFLKKLYRGVEQLVARRAHNPKVIGSSPIPATERKALSFERVFLLPENHNPICICSHIIITYSPDVCCLCELLKINNNSKTFKASFDTNRNNMFI